MFTIIAKETTTRNCLCRNWNGILGLNGIDVNLGIKIFSPMLLLEMIFASKTFVDAWFFFNSNKFCNLCCWCLTFIVFKCKGNIQVICWSFQTRFASRSLNLTHNPIWKNVQLTNLVFFNKKQYIYIYICIYIYILNNLKN